MYYLSWYIQLLALLLLSKNNVTINNNICDVEVEVMMNLNRLVHPTIYSGTFSY